MRKFLFGIFFVFLFGTVANAVTKCVYRYASSECSVYSAKYGSSEWAVSCGGKKVFGVGACSFNFASNMGNSGVVTGSAFVALRDETIVDNKYCWCRMMYPLVSYWIYAVAFDSPVACMHGCAQRCAEFFVGRSNFTSVMYASAADYAGGY